MPDRRAAVLSAVVAQYIETSEPVSSSSVVAGGSIEASPATVRSEMAALEREGFLQQPHTSAGRIPTDRGYRFFVDNMENASRLAAAQQQDVRVFFDAASGEIESMLNQTGRLLSTLTGAASVVVAPADHAATVKSAQLVLLSESVALAVVVMSDGSVKKSSVRVPSTFTENHAQQVSRRLGAQLSGASLGAAAQAIAPTGHSVIDSVVDRTLLALSGDHAEDGDEKVFVGGASLLANAFDAVEVVRNVLAILEQQYLVVTLMRDLLDRGMTVSIGEENKMQTLDQCSLVVAPTMVDGEQRGSVAVLGPTRMDYSQAMAAVTIVSRNLGERLAGSQQ